MDYVYQKDHTFTDIDTHTASTSYTNITPLTDSSLCPNGDYSINNNNPTQPLNASRHKQHNKNHIDATVTQDSDHVTDLNASDEIDVTQLVDQLVSSRGSSKNLSASIHAPKRPSIVNLPPKDLRHRLNALRHKSISDRPGFLLLPASSIPGSNRLDKLNFVRDLFRTTADYRISTGCIMINKQPSLWNTQIIAHRNKLHKIYPCHIRNYQSLS